MEYTELTNQNKKELLTNEVLGENQENKEAYYTVKKIYTQEKQNFPFFSKMENSQYFFIIRKKN